MPYIDQTNRKEIDECGLDAVYNIGGLNYFITTSILKYLGDVPSYKRYNEILGVLEAIKLEFYRKVISKYEDEKCKLNGDVYE